MLVGLPLVLLRASLVMSISSSAVNMNVLRLFQPPMSPRAIATANTTIPTHLTLQHIFNLTNMGGVRIALASFPNQIQAVIVSVHVI